MSKNNTLTTRTRLAMILNLLDLAFTLHALQNGAVELNPAMRCVPVMVFYKIVIVGILIAWLGKRPERVARAGLNTITVAYAAVNVWHIINIL